VQSRALAVPLVVVGDGRMLDREAVEQRDGEPGPAGRRLIVVRLPAVATIGGSFQSDSCALEIDQWEDQHATQ
jgi:hypothetical protein